jgi:hypothetical protein
MIARNPDDLFELRVDMFEELGDIRFLGCSVFLQLFDLNHITCENETIDVVLVLNSEISEFEM